LDRTALSPWLLGFGCFLTLTVIAVVMLILQRYPDPALYRNSIAFTAIIGFFVVFYFAMGRGWYSDVLSLLDFDSSLEKELAVLVPARPAVYAELVLALVGAWVNLQLNDGIDRDYSTTLVASVYLFYFMQYVLVVLSIDIVLRQLVCLSNIANRIRISLLEAEFYSTLANVMVRFVGLYIFGLCIISFSYIIFTEGELAATDMMVIMMPWYLPGLVIISLYLLPYNRFRRRMHFRKAQELNCVHAALAGNAKALEKSLLKDEPNVSTIDLMYYQDRISGIKEWPFTDRIRALVLFGILPPLTWVIAALIEIFIEGAL
jgi:hypothetical protein